MKETASSYNVDVRAEGTTTQTGTCNDSNRDYRGETTMEAGGSIALDDPGYVTNDDVMSSIAEGYF